jgi:hypothetical protein
MPEESGEADEMNPAKITLELIIDEEGRSKRQVFETMNWQLIKETYRCAYCRPEGCTVLMDRLEPRKCRGYDEECRKYLADK